MNALLLEPAADIDESLIVQCHACGGMNKPGAKQMIVLEPDGSYFCMYCGTVFRFPPIPAPKPDSKP